MLSDHPAMPCLAVRDLGRARRFYEQTLGFRATQPPGSPGADDMGVVYATGSGGMLVYPSSYAGTNRATAVTFQVADEAFDREVGALRSSGIGFETFELPSGEWRDGVLVDGAMRAVWFEDPDGNVLNLQTVEAPAGA
ncbi:VOC family protein [Cellulomonas pakistanensis]|uniref:Glyoxalase n=1 Tax=Cellulomonas pakistanensis TaxID=992287 RepID=A0A919U6M6_9CELL|nr:VOC family protein [Cellulomonas pakistanensis]GIG36415.1 glyoxalase [Cellulomonas pakistanensis]